MRFCSEPELPDLNGRSFLAEMPKGGKETHVLGVKPSSSPQRTAVNHLLEKFENDNKLTIGHRQADVLPTSSTSSSVTSTPATSVPDVFSYEIKSPHPTILCEPYKQCKAHEPVSGDSLNSPLSQGTPNFRSHGTTTPGSPKNKKYSKILTLTPNKSQSKPSQYSTQSPLTPLKSYLQLSSPLRVGSPGSTRSSPHISQGQSSPCLHTSQLCGQSKGHGSIKRHGATMPEGSILKYVKRTPKHGEPKTEAHTTTKTVPESVPDTCESDMPGQNDIDDVGIREPPLTNGLSNGVHAASAPNWRTERKIGDKSCLNILEGLTRLSLGEHKLLYDQYEHLHTIVSVSDTNDNYCTTMLLT